MILPLFVPPVIRAQRRNVFSFHSSTSKLNESIFIYSPTFNVSRSQHLIPLKPASVKMTLSMTNITLSQATIEVPDDTAVDMLTFALSGPGFIAFAALVSLGLFFFLSFAELGTLFTSKKSQLNSNRLPYILRVNLPKDSNRNVEFSESGLIRNISKGESIFRFETLQALNFVVDQIQNIPDSQYFTYRLNGLSVRTLSQSPDMNKNLNIDNSKWEEANSNTNNDKNIVQNDLQNVWDEYELLDSYGDLEKEWKDYVNKNLGKIVIEDNTNIKDCKLCGGTGLVKCSRCGGVRSSGNFACDCNNGKKPCDWCS